VIITPSVTVLTLLFCAVANMSIGIYVFTRNLRSPTHRIFLLYALLVAAWAFGIALTNGSTAPNLQYAKLSFAAGALIPIAMLRFAEHFPSPGRGTSVVDKWIFTPLGLAFSLLAWSPWLLTAAEVRENTIRVSYGPLHLPFSVYVLACFVFVIFILLSTYREATGVFKLQTKYLLVAFSVPTALAMVTNVVIPLTLGSSTQSKLGPIFSLIMLGLIGHAIIRHRFMDIRVVIRQGVVYLAAFAVAGMALILLLVASNVVLRDDQWFSPLEILLALGIAVLFHPLKTRIQLAFDRYLYREPYDYQRIIRETSRTLSNTIELPEILDCVGGVMRDVLKSEWIAVYLLDEDEGPLERVWVAGTEVAPLNLAPTSPLAKRAIAMEALVFRDELVERADATEAMLDMTQLNADVAAPLFEEGRLFGLIVLGPKRSGSPYFTDDADLLQTLAHQSAVAIRNAQTHQRVVQVNEELRKTLATIESGVVAVGIRGRVTVFNKAAEHFTGLSAEALRGRGIEQLPPILARLIEATLDDGQSRSQVEIALPDQVGQLVPLMCTTTPLRSPQGALVGAVTVFSDLSRLKELEHERRRAERLASLEAIASGMVHEIRNPLVAIKTFTQLLPSRFDDAGFRENFSRVAGREIARMDDLLDRFRMLSSASRQPMEPVDITVPLRDTLELLQPRLEERRVTLRRVGESAPRSVLGNASQLEQLFLNLCLNALEAMDPGGELTVRVADLSEGGGSTLLVEVSDTGSGIPEDMVEQIFNPFVTSKAHGTGLGLAICRAITDAHRAILRARNNIGRPGCTFTVEFPVPVAKPARVTA
jgi:PAS domain S-box-containing protein